MTDQFFSHDDLVGMQETQTGHMMDAVMLMKYTETKDAMNHGVASYVDNRVLQCGINMTGSREDQRTDKGLVTWDASLRLPLRTVFDLRDRVRVLWRFGEPSDDNTVYEFAGPAKIGPSGMVVPLKKVAPGT